MVRRAENAVAYIAVNETGRLRFARNARTGCGVAGTGISAAGVPGERTCGVWIPIQHSSAPAAQKIRHTWLRDGQRSNACGRRAEREKNEEDGGKYRFHDESEH